MTDTPEAPASMNVRFASTLGYDYILTVRSFAESKPGGELLGLIPDIEKALQKLGCKPIYGKNSGKAAKPAPAQPEQKPKEIICPEHNAKAFLKTNKETGAQWYSHKLADDSWCNVDEPK